MSLEMDQMDVQRSNRMFLKWIFSVLFASLLIMSGAWGADHTVRTKPLPGTVTLTFDDGPSPVYTPQVLAILKRYNIHAVFFVMAGLAKAHPAVVKQIIASGNTVQSHTIWHPKLTKLSASQLQREIAGSKQIIQSILGHPPVCLRPPYFLTNKNVSHVITANGMTQVMGYMTEDYKPMGVQPLIHHVLSVVRPGMVLVFHDGDKGRAQTVAALPAIIEGIQHKGIGFSTICQ